MDFNLEIGGIPNQDWNKTTYTTVGVKVKDTYYTVPVYGVSPQARLIGATVPFGLLEGYAPDSILAKAFQKNYKTEISKPGVVTKYGLQQKHGEPIELLDYVFECIYDRACEAEMNRYRHNSKNYESGRYVDYLKHGVTVVFPFEKDMHDVVEKMEFINDIVVPDITNYAKYLNKGWKKQHARRAFGTYLAVESVIKTNLRSLIHMATQRSSYSPNGREAEPEINSVVSQMIDEAMKYLPFYKNDVMAEIAKGYR